MKGLHLLDKLANLVANNKEQEAAALSRRVWLQNFGAVSASSAVLWACGSDDDAAPAAVTQDPKADALVLDAAAKLENEAISLYTQAAGLSIWTSDTDKAVLSIAAAFLAHHTSHLANLKLAYDAMIALDSSIPAMTAKLTDAEYLAKAKTDGADLSTVKGVLRLASGKEGTAAKVYLAQASKFTVTTNAEFSANHGGDEAAHYGVIRAALFALYSDTAFIADGTKVVPAALAKDFSSAITV